MISRQYINLFVALFVFGAKTEVLTLEAENGALCEPITMPMCKNLPYSVTAFPNSFGHELQEEAGLEVC